MLLRLIPDQGGDGTVHGIIAMNDTGSDILSLFDTDMPHLGNLQGYAGWLGNIAIRFANGAINIYPKILVEVQLVRNDDSPWSDWIEEEAIVQPLRPGLIAAFRCWNQGRFVYRYCTRQSFPGRRRH